MLPSRWASELPLVVESQHRGDTVSSGSTKRETRGNIEVIEPAVRLVSTTLAEDDRALKQDFKRPLDRLLERFPNAFSTVVPFSPFPSPVLERMDARPNPHVEFGLFPEISFAWAAVDTSFFMWRADSRTEVPLEHSGEGQVVTTASLVRPRPGVFTEAIEWVVVVCTVVEATMLALYRIPAGEGEGAKDGLVKWELRPIPGYSAPSDAVPMRCAAATPGGRVFLGGGDGRVYELTYRAGGTWPWRRCQLSPVTGSGWGLLPSFVPRLLPLTWRMRPVRQLAVDTDRGVLYALSGDSRITLLDLGPRCASGPEWVSDSPDLREAAALSRAEGATLLSKSDADVSKRGGHVIIHVAPVSPGDLERPSSRSSPAEMVAVTANGTRCYFSARSFDSLAYAPPGAAPRPSGLTLAFVQAPPQRPGMALAARPTGPLALLAQHQSRAEFLDARAAAYHRGEVVLASRGPPLPLAPVGPPSPSTHVVVSRCDAMQAHAASVAGVLSDSAAPTASEPQSLPGPPVFVAPLPSSRRRPVWALLMRARDRPTAPGPAAVMGQLYGAGEAYLVLTRRGTTVVERKRPLDALVTILQSIAAGLPDEISKIREVVEVLGPAEGAALLLTVGTAPEAGSRGAATEVAEQARLLFYDASVFGDSFAALDEDPNPRPAQQGRMDGGAGAVGVPQGQPGALGAVVSGTGLGGAAAAPRAAGAPGAYQPLGARPAAPAAAAAAATSDLFDMGRVIVESTEPVSTPQHRGAALFVARVLRPVWNEPAFRSSSAGPLVVTFPPEALSEIEARLRGMETFLRHAQGRRVLGGTGFSGFGLGMGLRGESGGVPGVPAASVAGASGSVLFGGGGMGGMIPIGGIGGMGGLVPPPSGVGQKRKRAEDAARQEEESLARLNSLAARICEALSLLRIAARQGISVPRPGAPPSELTSLATEGCTLASLATTSDGEARLRQVAAAIVATARSVGGERGASLADDMAARLSEACPTFFPREDADVARAWSLLQRAESTAADITDRRAWADAAAALIVAHPQEDQFLTAADKIEGARLWETLVTLVVRYADAVGGGPLGSAAAPPGAPGDSGPKARRRAYDVLRGALSRLAADPSVAAAIPAGLATGGAAAPPPGGIQPPGTPSPPGAPVRRGLLWALRPSAAASAAAAPGGAPGAASAATASAAAAAGAEEAEKLAARKRILRAAASSGDPRLLESLFAALLERPECFPEAADPDLGLLGLEEYLRAVGFGWPAAPSGPSPPVDREGAVRHLELLGRLYGRKGRYEDACLVYDRLARLQDPLAPSDSQGGLGAMPLARRIGYLETAGLQARASGSPALVASTDESLALVTMQAAMLQRVLDLLSRHSSPPHPLPPADLGRLHDLIRALDLGGLLGATELHDIAERLRMWDLCLESLALSGYRGAAAESLARSLWDRLLKSRLADVWNASGPPMGERMPADPGASEDEDEELYGAGGSIARGVTLPLLRAAACHEVERLGARLFPSDTCLPLAHVALRLEGLASRSWPPELWRAGGAESLGRDEGSAEGIACALVAGCKGTWEHPVRAYESILFLSPPRRGLSRAHMIATLRYLLKIACTRPEDTRSRELALAMARRALAELPRAVSDVAAREPLEAGLKDAEGMLRCSLLGVGARNL